MELTKASSEYVVLPNGFTGRMALLSSFSSTVWINLKTVGSKHGESDDTNMWARRRSKTS